MGDLVQKYESQYLAIIGDVRGSRQAAERTTIQRSLEKAIAQVNQVCRDDLAASFVLTIGDEFQGLLGQAAACMKALVALENLLIGVPMRYGFGWGTLTTELLDRAIGMDGPSFHRAREALVAAKSEDRWVAVRGFGTENDSILNGVFALMGGVRARWKEKQERTVALMRHHRYQKEVAAARGVVDSVVSDTLKAALYSPMVEAEQAVASLLERFAKTAGAAADPPDGRRT